MGTRKARDGGLPFATSPKVRASLFALAFALTDSLEPGSITSNNYGAKWKATGNCVSVCE
jgi:hypothetical protein